MPPLHAARYPSTLSSRPYVAQAFHTASPALAWQRRPVARAVAMLLAAGAAGSATPGAQAQQAFSSAWFASKGATQNSAAATGYLPNGTPAALLTNPSQQQQQANAQLQRSINNLSALARGIAAQQAAQEAARQAALANGAGVPDGLADGALKVDTNSLTRGWFNANAPTQSATDGKTTVSVQQTADKAILNWETFNVGKNTILSFAQNANWAVLNRINDPLMRPSQIQGQISGNGTVMIANRNGVVFAGSSQIDVRNLVAAAAKITDAQFRDKGLYVDTLGSAPTFTDAAGKVLVEAGAQIATRAPQSATQDGGYVLLLGTEVGNAGRITTPSGQTALAAGDSFIIRKGVGTDANLGASTAGNEVSPGRTTASGAVRNTGLIAASTGDITMTGHTVTQAGVALASTALSKRGTVHLSTRAGDAGGTVTLAADSVTGIVLEAGDATALDSQRSALLQRSGTGQGNQYTGAFDNLSTVADRKDLSRIEIVSGNTVEFQGGSMALATGGEIVVSAPKRTLVNNGATLDVSGAVGVKLTMESNNIAINVQGNEQRDAPINRDSKNLNNANLWIDRRSLVYVPAGTNGYASDRWYTAGGLLEVSGYLGTSGHTAGEWMAQGGTVTVTGGDLVTRAGSSINLSGGTLDVASGTIRQSWLKGSDGRLYEVNQAPGDLLYGGMYRGFEVAHARWGDKTTEYYYNPLIAPQSRLENGYTVGRDAGRLIVATNNAVLEGSIVSEAYQGPRQTRAPQADLDGYAQSHYATARRAQLVVGQYQPVYDSASGGLRRSLSAMLNSVTLGNAPAGLADGIALNDAIAADRQGSLVLDSAALGDARLGALRIASKKNIDVRNAVQLADGGEIVLFAPLVDVAADITAHGGAIRLGNVLRQINIGNGIVSDLGIDAPSGAVTGVNVRGGVRLDATGRFSDLRQAGSEQAAQAYVDGGTVSLRSSDSVSLAVGSVIDVSSGAAVQGNGSVAGGKGGSVQLGSGLTNTTATANPAAVLTVDGEIRAYGVKGGGKLDIEAASAIVIGGKAVPVDGVLEAGHASLAGLILKEDYLVRAGDILPVPYKALSYVAAPGTRLEGGALATNVWYTLADDWVLPAPSTVTSNAVRSDTGQSWVMYHYSTPGSQVIPRGTRVQIYSTDTGAFGDYIVPRNVFPNGMQLRTPMTVITPAGQVASVDFTISAGTKLAPGTRLLRTVQVGKSTSLPTDLFGAGFFSYSLRGYLGVAVPGGTAIDVTMPVWQPDLSTLAAGGDIRTAFRVALPALYQENATARKLTQRAGASVTLAAGVDNVGLDGALFIGEGAAVRVDPGQSIALSARTSLSVDGLLQARGGSITVLGARSPKAGIKGLEGGGGEGNATPDGNAIVLGAHAVLDASAESHVAVDALGRPYGVLTDGGSITIGGTLLESKARSIASDAFVVVREGAVVDASGASARLDVDGAGARNIPSAGGSIQLVSGRSIYLDGSLRARSGGVGAAGGSLIVGLEALNYESAARPADDVLVPRELMLIQNKSGGASDAGRQYGQAVLGVNQVRDGGFSSLALYSNGLVSFGGDLNLAMDKELRIYSGSLTPAAGIQRGINVSLAAPYVLLGGISDNGAAADTHVRPSFQGGVTTLGSSSALTVQGKLIDIKDAVTLGMNATQGRITVNRAGFDQLNVISEGDLRFAKGAGMLNFAKASAELYSHGDILLRAAQVYPATGASGIVRAGMLTADTFDPAGRLVIERFDPLAGDPQMPYSVFGSLVLGASNVEQRGVVRAPLGNVTLGIYYPAPQGSPATTLTLAAGSLTSVSAAGLVMPYGGTADGVNYVYLGSNVVFKGMGASGSLNLDANKITVAAGARLDLSGGGDLRGAGFISGRGGSTDARMNPLVQVSGKGFSLPGLVTNPVYAIVPGYASAYAPTDAGGAVDPRIGQRITIASNQIPGLAAGTYTLLPSNYALLPGAFRVEINGSALSPAAGLAVAMRNGSWSVGGVLGTANTGLADSVPRSIIVTPADTIRRYSQYNETNYAEFAIQQAALAATVRPVLPADAKPLNIFLATQSQSSLSFEGTADFTPERGGQGGVASIRIPGPSFAQGSIEILAAGAAPTPGFNGLSLHASDLNAIGASRLVIGGFLSSTYGTNVNRSNLSNFIDVAGNLASIVLRGGAILRAPDVFLITNNPNGGITIEAGAGINTIGAGKAPFDSREGYIYKPAAVSVLAASNGWLNMLAPQAEDAGTGAGAINIGACAGACSGATELYSEGTLLAATRRDFQLSDAVRYGTRNLVLAVGAVNAGSNAELAAAAARGALTPGLTLNQTVLDRLLRGDTAYGAPKLERLVLTAAESVNFFGDVNLSTIDAATGKSSLANLVLSTPAIYGYGNVGEIATISTGRLTWAGLAGASPAPIVGGRGTGAGQLAINADVIEFGYDASTQPSGLDNFGRIILGFSDVRIAAKDRITSNFKGALSVYQSQVAGANGPQYQGGNLTLQAPLITGAGGSVNSITAGGALQLTAPAGGRADPKTSTLETGAELKLSGSTVSIDTTVALPSGKLSVNADGDITLGSAALLDLAGREIRLFDVSRYSWGGDLSLQSKAGNVRQASGSLIDLSATNNNAGQLSAIALAGAVDLQGMLRGSASGRYDAGGTLVPYRAGSVDVRTLALGGGNLSADFAAFNGKLNDGGFLGERSFQLKQGDLVIGNELKAHQVNVSLDAGQLTLAGTIDASGEQVGSIRLSASNGLTLASGAVLDAHGTVLRVDSYGKIIDSPNRAIVQLDAGNGTLTLQGGSRIDLRHGTASNGNDGNNRGTLDLFAARVGNTGSTTDANAATFGDIAIDARGAIDVQGARSIALYGRQRYRDAAYGTDPAASGRPYQVIDQAYLDAKGAQATQFIDAALANSNLLNRKLAGLNNATYRQAFRLRPAIEIVSATPQGDLVVQGDLDLSGLRFNSLNPNTPKTGVYGSGEVGMLSLRAGGDLSIYGSVNDGFAPPPNTPDDGGWVLTAGVQRFGGDVVVPVGGVTLSDGTTYPAGKTLNYAITARNVTLPAGTLLPASFTLDAALTLPAGTVLAADVRAPNGTVLLAAGTVVGAAGLSLPAGAQLQAGARLPVAMTLASLTWPKGVALPVDMVQLGSLALPVGSLIASGTNVVLASGATSVNLRPADANGRQAKNWAVAPMLPEGSQSWSMNLTAGADTGAADPRARNAMRTGDLVLADTHYAVKVTGGGPLAVLNERGVDAVIVAAGGLPSGKTRNDLIGKTMAEIISLYYASSWDDFGLPDFWNPARGNIQLGLTLQGANAVVAAASGAAERLYQREPVGR
ncbi:MAG: Heme/hemopexin-binding protein [Herbaspirillum frisingense]|uniref:Heme/hemopexin-binding protein n=1 Tax=Herbaspirillum frisingense TaxID=92645 RepID=A0A7V8JW12_9BURK|nr:MAG: Heme/hemopexin-binding protein [Herbaspirillum frisingense]